MRASSSTGSSASSRITGPRSIRIEDGAHVGAHARERARGGIVLGAEALAQFARDALRKGRRAAARIDREGEFADAHGRLHREVAVFRIGCVADEDARRARIGDDLSRSRRSRSVAAMTRSTSRDPRARYARSCISSVGTIEQRA